MAASWKEVWTDKHVYLATLLVMYISLSAAEINLPTLRDQPPFQFTRSVYNATILENAVGKTYIVPNVKMGIYLSDPTWDVRYRIISGDDGSNTRDRMFKPEFRKIGNFCFLMIRTRTSVQDVINREIKPYYQLTVKAIVRGSRKPYLSAQAQVNLFVEDENDLTPLFLKQVYQLEVPEDTPVQSNIIRLTASDADVGVNGQVYYSFKESTDTFAIHPTSGWVSVLKPLDFAEKSQYSITVIAQDRGWGHRTTRCTLRIDVTEVNYHDPVIKIQELPVLLSQVKVGTLFAVVYVTDKDDRQNGVIGDVSMSSSHPGVDYFKLEKDTSNSLRYNIVVAKTLERDKIPRDYNLTITAEDRGSPPRTSSAKVRVRLGESNDHSPIFEHSIYNFRVEECAPVLTPIGKVHAADQDKGDNGDVFYSISEGNERNFFRINPKSGVIQVAGELDTETTSSLKLTVTASDLANEGTRKSSTVPLDIIVEDCNDITPRINETQVAVTVEENQPEGSPVYRLWAYDLDQGDNGRISFSITNQEDVPFEIEPLTGWIKTTEVLDYESMRRLYKLKVRASDWGKPFRRESEVIVKVRVKDLNDNKPMFEEKDCVGYLSREAPPGTSVKVVSALDFDASDIVSYHIISGNEDNCFEILSSTGVIKLRCNLHEDHSSTRSLVLTASDGYHKANSTTLNITLVNNNRNSQLANHEANINCVKTSVTEQYRQLLNLADMNNKEEDPEQEKMPNVMSNQNAPEFVDDVRSVHIKENLKVGALVTTLKAEDRDTGYSGRLQYVIKSGNIDGAFKIDTYSGNVSILSPLDRENLDHYRLTVQANDMGLPKKTAEMTLNVYIVDVNDCAPEFRIKEFLVEESEDLPVNHTIFMATANDRDEGLFGEIRYYMADNEPDFAVNHFSGAVTVAKKLDRERKEEYNFRIKAVDSGASERLTAFATVKVKVKDVNDNPPKFTPSSYHIQIREDLPVGTVVMVASAMDPDTGSGGSVRYSIIGGANGKFEMDSYTGVIRVMSPLDYETQQIYNMTLKARDRGTPSLSSTCGFTVEIVDVNENLFPPVFTEYIYKGAVKENASSGTSVLQVTTKDYDRRNPEASPDDYTVEYLLKEGNGLGRFTIDKYGNIHTAALLDRESTIGYWLTVYAYDKGTIPKWSKAEVYIEVEDVNDNIPQTVEPVYYPTVSENSAPSTSVVQLQAEDKDNNSRQKITYDITGGNPQGFFGVNRNTGLIYTTKRRLDREKQEEHILEVTVSDNGDPPLTSTTRVVVTVTDINDNAPQFKLPAYRIRLPERAATEVATVLFRVIATDEDSGSNADISYSIEQGRMNGRFKIHPKTGAIFSQREFNPGEEYDLTIKAVDNGRPQNSSETRVIFIVKERPKASANAPIFSRPKQTVSLMESEPVGELVCFMQAIDRDGDHLWYSIEDGNIDDVFLIHPEVGNIVLARPLDWETISTYNLTISATDGVHTVFGVVNITVLDINDNQPQFTEPSYKIDVYENTKPGTSIYMVTATDADDNKRLFYTIQSITDVGSRGKFDINSESDQQNNWRGVITTQVGLNREAISHHEMVIMVRDQGTPSRRSLARVAIRVLDINDHAPEFISSKFEGRIFRGAEVGTVAVTVQATDKDHGDNAAVQYMILSGNVGDVFTIDTIGGSISSTKSLHDFAQTEFNLVVVALDGGKPPKTATADVKIKVLTPDNAPPEFPLKEYVAFVKENQPVGTSVITVTARSQSSVIYEIIAGNHYDFFTINPNSGTIITAAELDHEKIQRHNLTVKAKNVMHVSVNVPVTIEVTDENDNAPVFEKRSYEGYIRESEHPGTPITNKNGTILVIRATDEDDGVNSQLHYRIVNSKAGDIFSIDPNTGALGTKVNLDHEVSNKYEFLVEAMDKGDPSMSAVIPAQVTIHVTDVNDSPPEFTKYVYEFTVHLPTYEGIVAATILATDRDANATDKLIYSIKDGNIAGTFTIDEETGVIKVAKPELIVGSLSLTVQVSDGQFIDTATVRLTVERPAISGLAFTSEKYTGEVPENSTKITNVVIVQVKGSALGEQVIFRILNPQGLFTVGETSGVVSTVGKPLDREVKDNYRLILEARDGRNTPRVTHAQVHVKVTDVNDNTPMFMELPYYADISVEADKGTVVKEVKAVDRDEGKNSEIEYHLVKTGSSQVNLIDKFTIDPGTGRILMADKLDKALTGQEFQLVVEAVDKGESPLSARATIQVRVVDSSMPHFPQPYYSVEIREDTSVGSIVVSLQATSPTGNKLIYSIPEGDQFGEFDVDFDIDMESINECTVVVASELDYETTKSYELKLRATDVHTGANALAVVAVKLKDVNDNDPSFSSDRYTASVSESESIGRSILKVSAKDSDAGSNAAISYSIPGSDPDSGHFSVDAKTGVVTLNRKLDYESKKNLYFTVRATDGGIPTKTSTVPVHIMVLDTSDNPPKFEPAVYTSKISDLATRGHFVAKVTATDPDESDQEWIAYSIVGGNGNRTFTIGEKTGIISVSSQHRGQFEPGYTLNLSATDGVFSTFATVTVQVQGSNNNAPSFSQSMYEVSVRENQLEGTIVTSEVSATDPDQGIYGQVKYSIVSEDAEEFFIISQTTGEVSLKKALDRESQVFHLIPIMATDGGNKSTFATIKVTVIDVGDNRPQFKVDQYILSINSTHRVGDQIVKIEATDLDLGTNAELTYSLQGGMSGAAEVFAVDAVTGSLTLKIPVTEKENEVFQFFVQAMDKGVPVQSNSVPVRVYIQSPLDNPPHFSQSKYSYFIPEDQKVGSVIATIQATTTHGIVYRIIPGGLPKHNNPAKFAISMSGQLSVIEELDRETVDEFLLTVVAETNTEPSLVAQALVSIKISLDVNDNAPAFEMKSYNVSVTENAEVGFSILTVRATDSDIGKNGDVMYEIARKDARVTNTLALDPVTGVITTVVPLDREQVAEYVFDVIAKDQSEEKQLNGTTRVHITVTDFNDNPPVFTQKNYKGTVGENAWPGTSITKIEARDADLGENAQVTYYITDGDPMGHFEIRTTGELYLSREVDRENEAQYQLVISATDGAHVTSATVTVDILDANDNDPVCLQPILQKPVEENVQENFFIGKITATDADEAGTRNSRIRFSLEGEGSEMFQIHRKRGIVSVAKSLDRETQPEFHFKAVAKDGDMRSCTTAVHVYLTDVNDNPPRFMQPSYHVHVREHSVVNSLVVRVSASDPDLAFNGKVRYSLKEGLGFFKIDPVSGIVSLTGDLDRETQDLYNLTVVATDQGTPPLSSEASLLATIIDINDNPPIFQRSLYEASVSEAAGVGTSVCTVFATSIDVGVNAEITYSIIGGNEGNKFVINGKEGVLTVDKPLDYEVHQEYILKIQAKDGGETPLTGMTLVRVNITDFNDNKPMFTASSYSNRVYESIGVGDLVVEVEAADQDSGVNAELRYQIVRGDPEGNFHMDAKTGKITVRSPLDRETVSSYTLEVQVTDQGLPPLSTTVPVHLEVMDANDCPPEFTRDNYTAAVQESSKPGYRVIQVAAMDKDLPPFGEPFTYDIIDGNSENKFRINPDGVISTTATFDRKIQDTYNLTVRVYDNGLPPLHSDIMVIVLITKESANPPVVQPLKISVNAYNDAFPGGEIGKIRAHDPDKHDQLHYAILSDNTDNFSVHEFDGTLRTIKPLDSGKYVINVSVSDGKFTRTTLVQLDVVDISEEMIANSVIIRMSGIDVEDFIKAKLPGMKKILATSINKADKIHVLSIQPALHPAAALVSRRRRQAEPDIEALIAAEKADGSYVRRNSLQRRVKSTSSKLENDLGVKVEKVYSDVCENGFCMHGDCSSEVTFSKDPQPPVDTPEGSFVSAHFRLEPQCNCHEGYGDPRCATVTNQCMLNPCTPPKICQQGGPSGYTCVCPSGLTGANCDQLATTSKPVICKDDGCPDNSAMTFSGQSYASWRFVDPMERRLSLSMQIRTYQPNARLVHAYGRVDYSIVELVSGLVQFRFDCGSGEGLVRVDSVYVNDGKWHSLLIERRGNDAEILIDGKHRAASSAPGQANLLNLDSNDVYFGAEVSSRADGKKNIRNGYQGCLKEIKIDNILLPFSGSNSVGTMQKLENVEFYCKESPGQGICSNQQCMNGGTCLPKGLTDYSCKCLPRYAGPRCEIDLDPCASSPCMNNGVCEKSGSSFKCKCTVEFAGPTCASEQACIPNPCHNMAQCQNTVTGPKCICRLGFTGHMCDVDVNECDSQPCMHGATCLNTIGSFSCNCTPHYTGQLCDSTGFAHITSTGWNITIPEIAGIAGGVVLLFLIVLIAALLCRRRRRKKHQDRLVQKGSGELTYKPGSFQPSPGTDMPPPVPKKPADYRRSLDDPGGDYGGDQYPSTFLPAGTPRITRNPLPPLPTEVQDDHTLQKPQNWDPNNPNYMQNHPDYKAPTKSLGAYADPPDFEVDTPVRTKDGRKAMHWDNYDLGLKHETPVPNIRGMPGTGGAPLRSHPSDDSLINNKIIAPEDYNHDPDTCADDSDGVDSDYIGDSEIGDQDLDDMDDPVSDYPDPPDYDDLVHQDNTAYNEYSLPRPKHPRMYNLHPNHYLPNYSLENSQNDLDQGGPAGAHLAGDDLAALGFPMPGSYAATDFEHSVVNPAMDRMSLSMDGQNSTHASMSDLSESGARLCEIEDSEANLSAEDSEDECTPLSQGSHTHTAV